MEYDLVFEGGGSKGSVFVGALQVFEEQGHTSHRLMGTSAGAITATLLAIGYNSKKIDNAITEKLPDGRRVFSTFMDIPHSFTKSVIADSLTYTIFNHIDIPFIPNFIEHKLDKILIGLMMKIPAYRQLFSFIERGGLYAGNAFLLWLQSKLQEQNFHPDITFSQLFEQTGKDLTLVASNTSIPEMLVLNHRTAPHCPVAWGVRMSMSIPFVWEEVLWQESWGPYYSQGTNNPGQQISGDTIVDGGVLSNFPIQLFIREDKEVTDLMGPNKADNVLGLLIDEKKQVPNYREDPHSQDNLLSILDLKQLKVVNRVSRLVDTMISGHDAVDIVTYADDICHLPAKGYGMLEFDMSTDRRQILINGGRIAMANFFGVAPA